MSKKVKACYVGSAPKYFPHLQKVVKHGGTIGMIDEVEVKARPDFELAEKQPEKNKQKGGKK